MYPVRVRSKGGPDPIRLLFLQEGALFEDRHSVDGGEHQGRSRAPKAGGMREEPAEQTRLQRRCKDGPRGAHHRQSPGKCRSSRHEEVPPPVRMAAILMMRSSK